MELLSSKTMTIKGNEKINKLLGFDFGEIYIFTLYDKNLWTKS